MSDYYKMITIKNLSCENSSILTKIITLIGFGVYLVGAIVISMSIIYLLGLMTK